MPKASHEHCSEELERQERWYVNFALTRHRLSRWVKAPLGLRGSAHPSTVADFDGRPFLQLAAGAFEFFGDEFLVWKDGLILGSEYLVGKIVECVVGLCCSFLGTQDKSNWRVLTRLHPVFAGVVQIEVHLSSVRITEFAHLEVDDDQAVQTPMEENQVDTKPCVVDTKPALAAKKRKIIAQLQEKVGKAVDQRFLQL